MPPTQQYDFDVTSTESEVSVKPLTLRVKKDPDVVVRFLPMLDLPGDVLEQVIENLELVQSAGRHGMSMTGVLRGMNQIVPLAMHPDDLPAWRAARIPVTTQAAVFERIAGFYGGAGSTGEGSASGS